MTIEELLQRLEGVRKSGAGWTARCPGHDDKENSLSITGKDGKILLHCFAGCPAEQICSSLGIDIKDLFEKSHSTKSGAVATRKKKSEPARAIVAEYVYTDEHGREVAKKVRYEPKNFSWFRAEWETAEIGQKLSWKPGLGSVRPPLYRWLEIKDSDWIALVEGEKDADNGRKIDLPTTTSGGTDTWRLEHAQAVARKNIVIIEDDDSPGRWNGRKIGRSIEAERDKIDWGSEPRPETKIITIPGSKDLSKALEKGLPREALLALIKDAPKWEPLAGRDLLDEIYGFARRFVALTEPQARAVSLWIAHTHAFTAADATAYLAIHSAEKQSGKTRLLEVLSLLAPKPWLTARVSPASLYRKIDAEKPTLLLDESDAAFASGDEYSEVLRGVLNAGFRTGGAVTVCVGQGKDITTKDFDCFCPKAIAGIGKLPDTVADRSVPIRLKRAKRGTVERLRLRKIKPEASRLETEIAAWAASNITKLREARPEMPQELTDRQADVTEPMIAIADLAGGNWPALGRESLMTLCELAQEEDDSLAVRLLSDIREVFAGRVADAEQQTLTGEPVAVEKIATADLLKALNSIDTSPWNELLRGRPLTPNKLARLLKPFEIVPRAVRIDGRVIKGYFAEHFEDAFDRYLPPPAAVSQ